MSARVLPLLFLVGCVDSVVAVPPSSGTTGPAGTTSGPAATTSSSSDPMGTSGSSGESLGTSSSDGGSSTGAVFDGPGCGVVARCDQRSIPGDVRVRSAEDLAELAGAQEIEGTLEIAESDLECLDALACLRIVGGDVRIQGNPALRSTAGLRNVEELGASNLHNARGLVLVTENPALEELDGFDELLAIDHSLTLWRNDALREITGFTGLRGLGLLSITNNASLEGLPGLHTLEQLNTCNVNQNPSLCISEVFEVCGDLETNPSGVTNNNDDEC